MVFVFFYGCVDDVGVVVDDVVVVVVDIDLDVVVDVVDDADDAKRLSYFVLSNHDLVACDKNGMNKRVDHSKMMAYKGNI